MNEQWCKHCGSKNHQSFDCSDKTKIWIPPPELQAKIDAEKRKADEEAERKRKEEASRPVFEEKPRWPGAPKICTTENLPAFETEEQARKWTADAPRIKTIKVWQCDKCKWWHHDVRGPDPAGDSNGDGRSSLYLAGLKQEKEPGFNGITYKEMAKRGAALKHRQNSSFSTGSMFSADDIKKEAKEERSVALPRATPAASKPKRLPAKTKLENKEQNPLF